MVVLRERADGKILGTIHGDPSTWIHSGQRTGTSVNLGLRASDGDPSTLWEGTLELDLDGADLDGDLIDGTAVLPVTLTRTTVPFTEEAWKLFDGSTEASIDLRRLENRAGGFVGGGFSGIDSCGFMACGGTIDSWSISGTTHDITTSSGGSCGQTGALSGDMDTTYVILMGDWTSIDCSSVTTDGEFIGGKRGVTSSKHIPWLLDSLADFADAFEAESLDAADLFHSAYLSDGVTRTDWEAQFSSWFTTYEDIEVGIEGPYEMFTFNDDEVNGLLGGHPRMAWTVRAEGKDSTTGVVETFWERDEPAVSGPDLRFLGIESGRVVLVGNGGAGPLDIGLPIQLADVGYDNGGAWPFGLHGGGHPEDGHGGIDFEFLAGTFAYAVESGQIVAIFPNDNDPSYTRWDVYQEIRPGVIVQYGAVLDPLLVNLGDVLGAGDPVGMPSPYSGSTNGKIHFGLEFQDLAVVCSVPWFDAVAAADWDAIWTDAYYTQELCEPLECNDRDAAPPYEATWDLETAGTNPGPDSITFFRADGYATDQIYTFYDALGNVIESGVTEWASSPGTLGLKLIADGTGAVTFGACDVVSDELSISLDASMPSTMAGAAVYLYQY